ncbi:BtpA/SgcQ family protein [Thalassococcus sp. S3]|uniref:BtpA/SgcQ family protein n=1 Tax=Thalassococcus sp. S3 TaxID=2017482 RepID=UPI0010243CD6|nr:BtpA/SgcQ family protein [Thalassococcus sp. S3]QBF32057.1 phosphoric monoester hydrolase [Thalassococcus sp. S3]
MTDLFAGPKPIIAALHLPDFRLNRHRSQAWFEDYALANARVFAEAGLPWIKLQDQTRTNGPATPETVARMAALARLIRAEFPKLGLGIIIEAHDPTAALTVAHASGAAFVRLKVFVGSAVGAEGTRHALGAEAVAHRAALRATGIAILADIHDRTVRPLSDEDQPTAAGWATKAGANGLVITGSDFADSLARIEAVCAKDIRRPLLIGGGVTAENVAQALATADGAVVSSALMRTELDPNDLVRWDSDLCRRFMDAAGGPA